MSWNLWVKVVKTWTFGLVGQAGHRPKVSLSDDLGHPNHQYLMCCTISQIMIRAYSGNIWLKYTLATCLRSNITILFHFWGQLDRTVVCKSGQKAIVVQLVFSRLPEIILVLSGSSSFLRHWCASGEQEALTMTTCQCLFNTFSQAWLLSLSSCTITLIGHI